MPSLARLQRISQLPAASCPPGAAEVSYGGCEGYNKALGLTLLKSRISCRGCLLERDRPMHIEIPPAAEPALRERASAAGFDKLEEYALRRILFDDAEISAMEAAAVDPQTIALFEEGLRSGPVATWTPNDFRAIREQIRLRNVKSDST